jgi:hypothetical protein
MGLYLARWCFTPQKPTKKAREKLPAAMKKWPGEDYPNIVPRPKTEGADLHCHDDRVPRSKDVRGRARAPKARHADHSGRPEALCRVHVLRRNQQNLIGWPIFNGALNSSLLIGFLRRLIKKATKKIFPILGNLLAHPAKPAKGGLAAQASAFWAFYPPSYRPKFNPDEMANADIKWGVTTLAPVRTKQAVDHGYKAPSTQLATLARTYS